MQGIFLTTQNGMFHTNQVRAGLTNSAGNVKVSIFSKNGNQIFRSVWVGGEGVGGGEC